MAIRTIRTEGDEILRKISKPVKEMTARTEQLIGDMIETLHESNGVGLAAVQVGVLKRICIISINPEDLYDTEDEEIELPEDFDLMHTGGEDVVVINPTIEVLDEETQTGNEGCLSVPDKFGTVTRPNHILLKAQDAELKPYELEAKALLARAICHECDHMDGVMYIDKLEGELHDVKQAQAEEEEE